MHLRLLFLVSLLLQGFCSRNTETNTAPIKERKPITDTITHSALSGNINVYYFHTSYRCHSCNTIERLTKEAVTGKFSQELQKGTITFTPVNIEADTNKHFIEKYKLVSKSVIVSKVSDNKENEWKNLDQIWFLLRKPDTFEAYVIEEIKKYLNN